MEALIKAEGIDAQHATVAKVNGREAIVKTAVSGVVSQVELQKALRELFKFEPAATRFAGPSIQYASDLKHALIDQQDLPKDTRPARTVKKTRRRSSTNMADAYVTPFVAKEVFSAVLGELSRIQTMQWSTNTTSKIKAIQTKAGDLGVVTDKAVSIKTLGDLVGLVIGAQRSRASQELATTAGAKLKGILASAAASGTYADELPVLGAPTAPINAMQKGLLDLFLGALEQNTKHMTVASTTAQVPFGAHTDHAAGAGSASAPVAL